MAKMLEPYQTVIVESYIPSKTTGLHGIVHIRPVNGQGFPENLHVQCSKTLSRDYPVGTKFKINAKLTDRKDGGEFLYSSYRWKFEVLEKLANHMPALTLHSTRTG
ncbi:hypothetical protein R0381_003444 [Jeongeupia wiesaeckerbachi]|uniref:hypothetical protein n=1 Tax=Jeongeupia wiesaeckerbachi TaxID=3051218 RepID=UPI003D80152C